MPPILAPYKIFKVGNKYVVKNNAGMVKATFDDRDKALQYLRALYVNVPGAAKKADKTKWTGKAPKPAAVKAEFEPQAYSIPMHGFFIAKADAEVCLGCGLDLDSPLHEQAADELNIKSKNGKHKFRRQGTATYKGAGWYPACATCGRPASDPDHDGDNDTAGGVDTDNDGGAAGPIGAAELAALPATQKCKFGDEQATKRVIWANGNAYIPVCDDHVSKAKTVVASQNDEVDEILDIEKSYWAPPFLELALLGFVTQAHFDVLLDRLGKVVESAARTEPRVEPPAASDTAPEAQKAFVTEVNGKTLITGTADVIRQMAADNPIKNQHMLGVNGKFVGAEKANRNGALWTTADLEMGVPSVTNGPLNWLHEARHVIGSIRAAQLFTRNEQTASDLAEPFIGASSVVWRWLYPDEAAVIEMASDANKLYYSMECVSENVHCGGCGEKASYGDYMQGKAGCSHMRERSQTRRFENPTFLGGAVIVPPVRPGWADAFASTMPQAAQLAEKAFDQAGRPDIPATEWETLMAQVVSFAS